MSMKIDGKPQTVTRVESIEYLPQKVWTVPNILTFARILLLPVLIYALAVRVRMGFLPAICVGVFMIATDLLDGVFARRLKQSSRLGMILDPISDKLIIGALAAYFAFEGKVPIWIATIVIARDITILVFSIPMVKRGLLPVPVIWGRLTPFVFGLSFLLVVAKFETAASILMIIALVLGVFSAGSYYDNYKKVVNEKQIHVFRSGK